MISLFEFQKKMISFRNLESKNDQYKFYCKIRGFYSTRDLTNKNPDYMIHYNSTILLVKKEEKNAPSGFA